LFGSLNGGNGKFIPLFESLNGREWNGLEGTLVPLYSLKTLRFRLRVHKRIEWNDHKRMEMNGIEWNHFMTILLLDPYFKIKNRIYRGILRVLVKKSLNLISFPPIPSNFGRE
jgi:hypothetical protein